MNKLFLFSLLMLTFGINADSQNISKLYRHTASSQGGLYFVLPQRMKQKAPTIRSAGKQISYDYTYLDTQDSVTLLVTLPTEDVLRGESLSCSIHSGGASYPLQASFLYRDPKGGHWESRLRMTFPYTLWKAIYQQPAPYTIVFTGPDGQPWVGYGASSGAWEGQARIYRKLFEVIELNRPKKDEPSSPLVGN